MAMNDLWDRSHYIFVHVDGIGKRGKREEKTKETEGKRERARKTVRRAAEKNDGGQSGSG